MGYVAQPDIDKPSHKGESVKSYKACSVPRGKSGTSGTIYESTSSYVADPNSHYQHLKPSLRQLILAAIQIF